MGFFESLPQISATSSAFTLTSEIISADTLNIFVWAIVSGISCGLLYAILKKVTNWVWK